MAWTPSKENGTAKLFPQKLRSASHHQAVIALYCVCEHLCFISTYSVYLFARCVPKVIASSLYTIWAYKRFHGNALFSDTGETCIGNYRHHLVHYIPRTYLSYNWKSVTFWPPSHISPTPYPHLWQTQVSSLFPSLDFFFQIPHISEIIQNLLDLFHSA